MSVRTIASIADLAAVDRGVLDLLFQAEIARILADLHDRPNLAAARKLAVEIQLTPRTGSAGTLEGTAVSFAVKATLPPQRTLGYDMGLKGTNALIFNDLAPENHRQRTIDELAQPGTIDPETGEVAP